MCTVTIGSNTMRKNSMTSVTVGKNVWAKDVDLKSSRAATLSINTVKRTPTEDRLPAKLAFYACKQA